MQLLRPQDETTPPHHSVLTLPAVEPQRCQAQPLQDWGLLVGDIAHDFNNLLGTIMGYAEITGEEVQPDSRAGKNLQHIITASERARDLVQKLLIIVIASGRSPDSVSADHPTTQDDPA